MTPDQDLSARLCPNCGQPLIDLQSGITHGGKMHITCPPPGGWPPIEPMITAHAHAEAVKDAVAKAVEAERARTQAMHRRAQEAEGAIAAANNWLKWFEPRFLDAKRDGSEMYGRWLFREMIKALGRAAIRSRGVAG